MRSHRPRSANCATDRFIAQAHLLLDVAQGLARRAQHHVAQQQVEAGVLGEVEERRRAEQRRRSGWFQRTSASMPVVAPWSSDTMRLQVGDHLAALQAGGQVVGQAAALVGVALALGDAALGLAAAGGLGLVHGQIGVGEQPGDGGVVVVDEQGDAHAGGDPHRPLGEQVRHRTAWRRCGRTAPGPSARSLTS